MYSERSKALLVDISTTQQDARVPVDSGCERALINSDFKKTANLWMATAGKLSVGCFQQWGV